MLQGAEPATASCPHCGAAVMGQKDAFCCSGCELAWDILHNAGLEDYYARREALGTRPQGVSRSWQAVSALPRADGLVELTIWVDGLRCSSCTWVVERLLERTPGVEEATVSYATGRSRIAFSPDAIDVDGIVRTIAAVGYTPRPLDASPPPDDLMSRLGVAAFCTANLMLLSISLYAGWADGMAERFAVMFRWGTLALATPIALYAAAPFLQGAWNSLRLRTIGMDVPIALAVSVLYSHGVYQTLTGAEGYLDSLGMLVTLLLAGRVLERRGRRAAAEASAAIAAALPLTARRRTERGVEDVAVEELALGDILEIGTGEEIPADGVVVSGEADVQMAMLTGEAAPAQIRIGSTVVAGASVIRGSLGVRVERLGQQTLAVRMADAVRDATDRALPPDPAERFAPVFTAATVGAAVLAGAVWGWIAGPERGMQVAVATLVVACPCALGLSVPLAVSAGLGAVARRGVVLKNGASLLALADVRTLAMDKTGTVTAGEPVVLEAEDEVLRIAASLERSSRHPIARALLAEADRRDVALHLPERALEVAGRGVTGTIEGVRYRLHGEGPGRLVLEGSDGTTGALRLGDRPRDDAAQALEMLRRAGVEVTLLSGDHAEVTDQIAAQVGLRHAIGGMDPVDKADWIEAHTEPVAFVGDGLNDGPALAAADVGLAMHSGVTSSLLIADGVVTQPALRPVVAAFAGARATQHAVRANVRRAVTYNVVAVLAAVLGFINPLVAAVLMPLSSLWVVWGALSVERRLLKEESQWTS